MYSSFAIKISKINIFIICTLYRIQVNLGTGDLVNVKITSQTMVIIEKFIHDER